MTEFLHHYAELMSDPAHTAVEFTFVLLDVLIIDAVRRRWRKHLDREHQIIDAEHGVVHPTKES